MILGIAMTISLGIALLIRLKFQSHRKSGLAYQLALGISTVLMLATLALTKKHEEKPPAHKPWLPLIVVLVTGAALVYGTLDIPAFTDPDAPAHKHVAPRYIEEGYRETGVPNLVTAVLASYRGFDTLGEVTVIFTAGIGVLLLLGRRRSSKRTEEDKNET